MEKNKIYENAKHFLRMAQIRQYPPRQRTIAVRERTGLTCKRIQYPWLTFGEVIQRGAYNAIPFPIDSVVGYDEDRQRHKYFHCLVWHHDRPWKTIPEATKILRIMPAGFHFYDAFGKICLGGAEQSVYEGKMTTEQAFWFTNNIGDYSVADKPNIWETKQVDWSRLGHFMEMVYIEPGKPLAV